jgi:hypothetical protein
MSKIAARKAVGLCLLDVLTQRPPPLSSDYRLCLTFAEGVGGGWTDPAIDLQKDGNTSSYSMPLKQASLIYL